jgi:hypothetical protein
VAISTRKVGFLVLYEADIVLKFWLPMGGLGHCRTLTLMTHELPNYVKQWVRNVSKSGTNSTFFHFSGKKFT